MGINKRNKKPNPQPPSLVGKRAISPLKSRRGVRVEVLALILPTHLLVISQEKLQLTTNN
jgi:hypothetical protein